MFETEKRKGVPTRGLLYLMAGVVIGVVGMLIVTSISNRNGQTQEPTSLPLIPTPAMGVTGTAAAQTVPTDAQSSDKQLHIFAVDENNEQLALSYNTGQKNVLEIRPWQNARVGTTPVITLADDPLSYRYTRLSFNALGEPPTLLASSYERKHINIFNTILSSENVLRGMDNTLDAVYSPDGIWMAVLQDTFEVKISRTPPGYFEAVPHTGAAAAIAFSADSTMLAVVSMDKQHYHRWHIQVFRLPAATPIEATIPLTPVKSFTFEAPNVSPITFTPDNHLVAAVDTSIRVLSLQDDEQHYFQVETPIRQLAVDATGKWLAVLGGEADAEGHKLITLYSLDDTPPLPPTLSVTQTIRMNDSVIGVQFVKDGLLVGEAWGNITLYRWTGELWGDPTMVMENFE